MGFSAFIEVMSKRIEILQEIKPFRRTILPAKLIPVREIKVGRRFSSPCHNNLQRNNLTYQDSSAALLPEQCSGVGEYIL